MTLLFRKLVLGVTLMALVLGLNGIVAQSANAEITKMEEGENQVVYQSRQKLFDRQNKAWQAIGFQRIKAEEKQHFTIRLSGFPGRTKIAHPQPLTVKVPTGKTFYAEDISAKAFVDQAPTGNIGQYDFEEIISELPNALEVVFSVPTTDGKTLEMPVSPLSVQEWKKVAQKQ